jgi:diaminohydroxyphosphoribosylaminopyrimidine deaminase/5-amino-6-(5-phosphoribosylamino)uracil reductase
MTHAINLADNGAGFVSPNPKVGAIIVKNNKIISEGWHIKYGSPHAEVNAIEAAGIDDFSDCILYVNLEPCSHYGKTPPCADLIISKNFKKVVVGMQDPNPLVSGNGIQKLKNAGIEVVTDVCKEESLWLNRKFVKFMKYNFPYIMLKVAQSLDGCIALSNGESKWITSEESLIKTHKLRSEYDAVLVGKSTVLKDNPLLTVRSVAGRNPLRVVCDTNLTLPHDLSLFKLDDNSKTVICCSETAAQSRKARNLSLSGINILPVETNIDNKLNLKEVVIALRDNFEITSIMAEGGSGIFSSFMKSGLVDELQLFTAPKIMGSCKNSFEEIFFKNMNQVYEFKIMSLKESGKDIHTILVPI